MCVFPSVSSHPLEVDRPKEKKCSGKFSGLCHDAANLPHHPRLHVLRSVPGEPTYDHLPSRTPQFLDHPVTCETVHRSARLSLLNTQTSNMHDDPPSASWTSPTKTLPPDSQLGLPQTLRQLGLQLFTATLSTYSCLLLSHAGCPNLLALPWGKMIVSTILSVAPVAVAYLFLRP
jgi:hypothetical protein